MAKKAYLVGFSTLTRVDVDIEDESLLNEQDLAKVVVAAREQMLQDISDYLCVDTCDRTELDEECPYDPNEECSYEQFLATAYLPTPEINKDNI